jgi:hypothetical protein
MSKSCHTFWSGSSETSVVATGLSGEENDDLWRLFPVVDGCGSPSFAWTSIFIIKSAASYSRPKELGYFCIIISLTSSIISFWWTNIVVGEPLGRFTHNLLLEKMLGENGPLLIAPLGGLSDFMLLTWNDL